MPAWFAAAVPFVIEPLGQLEHEVPASLYAFGAHTVQFASTLEPTPDWVPAGQFIKPGAEVLVPTAPPPAQYLFAGQVTGELLLGVPDM